MPPTKSTAGKLVDVKASTAGRSSPVINGMKGRKGCNPATGNGTGMKSRMGVSPAKGLMQQILPFKAVKPSGKRKSKKKLTTDMILSGNKKQDEALLKLRIPLTICTVLPSVKKFTAKSKGTKGKRQQQNMLFEVVQQKQQVETLGPEHHPVFSLKKRRTDIPRYEITYVMEHRFEGMIWDLAFTKDRDIVVTGSEGALLCDGQLKVKAKFENLFLPGAIAFLSDGRILIVDRSSDTVNFYRRNAGFIRSFGAGKSPMGMVVTSKDEVVVSDTGDKCVRKFNIHGKLLMTIPTDGDSYHLRWPLYLSRYSNDDLVVSDVHQQKVLRFDSEGKYVECLALKTHSGSSVLRPHGVCVTNHDELMAIDTSIETLELFLAGGTYMQTLIAPESGTFLEPKLCKLNKENTLLGVGGMTGIIRLYQLHAVVKEEYKKTELMSLAPTSSSYSLPARASTSTSSANNNAPVKVEIKQEPVSH